MTRSLRSLTPILAVPIAWAVFSAPADAIEEKDFGYDTTKNLFEICSTPTDSDIHLVATLACRAFLEAAVQYHDAVTDRERLKRLICYPQGATIEDARVAFVAWAQANAGNAALMGEQPVKGVVRALAAKYPCSAKK